MTQYLMSGPRKKDLAREVRSTGLRGGKLNRRASCHGNSGENSSVMREKSAVPDATERSVN